MIYYSAHRKQRGGIAAWVAIAIMLVGYIAVSEMDYREEVRSASCVRN